MLPRAVDWDSDRIVLVDQTALPEVRVVAVSSVAVSSVVGVPLAPRTLTTMDPATPDGARIVIEERAAEEVGTGFPARNPAFDGTPPDLVTAVVAEAQVWRQ